MARRGGVRGGGEWVGRCGRCGRGGWRWGWEVNVGVELGARGRAQYEWAAEERLQECCDSSGRTREGAKPVRLDARHRRELCTRGNSRRHGGGCAWLAGSQGWPGHPVDCAGQGAWGLTCRTKGPASPWRGRRSPRQR